MSARVQACCVSCAGARPPCRVQGTLPAARGWLETRHSRSACRGGGHSPLLRMLLERSSGGPVTRHPRLPQDRASSWALHTHSLMDKPQAGGLCLGQVPTHCLRRLCCQDWMRASRQRATALPTHSRAPQMASQPRRPGSGMHLACPLAECPCCTPVTGEASDGAGAMGGCPSPTSLRPEIPSEGHQTAPGRHC